PTVDGGISVVDDAEGAVEPGVVPSDPDDASALQAAASAAPAANTINTRRAPMGREAYSAV
ncbi:MAG: hypothetical protein KDB12_16005, partial [Ilumatobacter sp.]|nr:hypothetical protein [Ilumatobacter sp.]